MALPLGLYVLLRGLDAPVLKRLQGLGLQYQVGGENPISFCNVFFFAQLVVGVAALLAGRRQVGPALAALTPPQRWLLVADTFLGRFLAPVAYFSALQSLSVISQTLLFALVLPFSALLARALLAEPLPRSFLPSLLLITAGLLLPQLAPMASSGPMDDPAGLFWALAAVLAFSAAALTGRRISAAGIPPVLSVGVGSLASALVFAVLAVLLYGPGHFLLLRLWWVVGVILIYALSLSLGSELALRHAYRHAGVATVSLWGSLSIAVAVLAAALLLGEPLDAATVAGVLLLLAGVALARRRPAGGLPWLGPRDMVGLIDFDSEVRDPVVLRGGAQDAGKAAVFVGSLKAEGGTRLHDAVLAGRDWLRRTRRSGEILAVVVLTDGIDSGSRLALQDLQEELRRSGFGGDERIGVFTIGYGRSGEYDPTALRKIAESNGGEFVEGTPESILRRMEDLQLAF